MRKVKKVLSSLLAGVLFASTLQGMSTFAANRNVYLDIHYVQDSETILGTNVQKGDVYVDIDFRGFEGITSLGLSLEVGSGLDFMYDRFDNPLYKTFNNINRGSVSLWDGNQRKIFWTTAHAENQDNGTYFRIYLRPNGNYSPETATVKLDVDLLTGKNKDGGSVTYIDYRAPGTMLQANEYVIGDTNGDGRVDATDASDVLRALSDNGNIPLYIRNGNPYYTESRYTNWFPNAVCMDAPDADQSEIINRKDADDIMNYYGNISSGGEGNPVDENGEHLNIGEIDIYEQY